MVSARRFASDEPALFKSTVDFIRYFSKVPDPVVAVSSRESDVSAKIAWTLLGTTLFQGIDYPAFVSVLSALQKQFPGDRLWNLPVPSVKEIQSCAESALQGYEWKLLPDVPGIFWSVGLFVRRHGNSHLPSADSRSDWPGARLRISQTSGAPPLDDGGEAFPCDAGSCSGRFFCGPGTGKKAEDAGRLLQDP